MYNTELPDRADLPTSRKLIRSTVLAALVAGVLLATTVLPAEYGIDPTGIGKVLGLTRMGEIKVALSQEAAADASVRVAAAPASPVPVPGPGPAVAVSPAAAHAPHDADTPPIAGKTAAASAAGKTDEMSLSLKPGQGAEVKLDMRKGSSVAYQWSVTGGAVNVDAHGDPVNPPKGFYHGYGKGAQLQKDAGTLVAAFDGKHGWFWRNRSAGEVTLKLSTHGQYTAIKRVL